MNNFELTMRAKACGTRRFLKSFSSVLDSGATWQNSKEKNFSKQGSKFWDRIRIFGPIKWLGLGFFISIENLELTSKNFRIDWLAYMSLFYSFTSDYFEPCPKVRVHASLKLTSSAILYVSLLIIMLRFEYSRNFAWKRLNYLMGPIKDIFSVLDLEFHFASLGFMIPPKKPHQYGSVCIYSWSAAPKTFTFNETLKDTRMQSILTTYCILTKSLITFLSGITL